METENGNVEMLISFQHAFLLDVYAISMSSFTGVSQQKAAILNITGSHRLTLLETKASPGRRQFHRLQPSIFKIKTLW